MYQQIEHLREISQRCLEGKNLREDLSVWLGHALSAYLERRSRSLEDAFGLQFPQGGVPWWREEAIRERDRAIRALAATYFSGHSTYGKAKAIRALAKRYAGTAWNRDRLLPAMPERYRGTAKAHLWRAFRSGAPMPLGLRQLQSVLG